MCLSLHKICIRHAREFFAKRSNVHKKKLGFEIFLRT